MVKAVIVLDEGGSRVAAKYFTKTELLEKKDQDDLERRIFKKTRAMSGRSHPEIVMVESHACVFQVGGDVLVAIVGDATENELILAAILETLLRTLEELLKGPVSRAGLLEHLVLFLLTVDEMLEGGIPLELDPKIVAARVLLRGTVPEALSAYQEMTLSSAMSVAREMVAKQFASGAGGGGGR